MAIGYSNFILYEKLFTIFRELLMNHVFYAAYSTNKETVYFGFKHPESKRHVVLNCKFVNGEIIYFFQLNNPLTEPKKGLPVFKNFWQQKIKNITKAKYDRSIVLEFENSTACVFKGFGKFGNILFFSETGNIVTQENIFRKILKTDLTATLSNWNSTVSKPELSGYIERFFKINNLQADGDFSEMDFKLSSNPATNPAQCVELGIADSNTNPLECVNRIGQEYAGNYYFQLKKNARISQFQKEIKKYRAGIKDAKQRLQKLQERRNFRELGDILLANASSIGIGVQNASLVDLYLGGKITIKLDPLLSVSENAARYYKKEQNAKIELEIVAKKIIDYEFRLAESEKALLLIEQADNFKEIPKENVKANPEKTAMPYKELVEGGQVFWIGKNAAGNDKLLKLASKNDWWFHAFNVQGSHVIWKKKGAKPEKWVLEFAAKLAAQNSKAKTQEIIPVQYTERKFVSKSRKSNPGEVNVLKFEVMDVSLK